MEIKLHNTTKIVEVNGVPARIWEGETESGIRVYAFITRIAVDKESDQEAFLKELEECRPPSADMQGFPLRLIL